MDTALSTDAYKFAMAQAGFPGRRETFYFSFRHGGWQYNPIDWSAVIKHPDTLKGVESAFLAQYGYEMTPAMRKALDDEFTVSAIPQHAWFFEREPIVTITGPSFLVSFLEPLVIRYQYQIQLATEIMRPEHMEDLVVTCPEQKTIAESVLDRLSHTSDPGGIRIVIASDAYRKSCQEAAAEVLSRVSADRVFEVGMRAASCREEHQICLTALRDLGITATSNVRLARDLDMTPVGTMGHEHVQRWGSDLAAFRAMRDMRAAGTPSYLLDTFDTLTSGIPAALQVYREDPHDFSVRYDSGDKVVQYMHAHSIFSEANVDVKHVIEDGLRPADLDTFEMLRRELTHIPDHDQVYGFGGGFVSHHWRNANPFTRDRVSAVYKLSESSGEPRMKFGNAEGLGKQSIPGRPIVWRRIRGSGHVSIIAQAGERPPEDFVLLTDNAAAVYDLRMTNAPRPASTTYILSPRTQNLVARVKATL